MRSERGEGEREVWGLREEDRKGQRQDRETDREFWQGQILGVRLPVLSTWVQTLAREDSTCHRATGPMRVLEPVICDLREALAQQ